MLLSQDKENKSNDDISSNFANEMDSSQPIKNSIYEEKNIYFPELFVNNNDFIERYKCGLCGNICVNPRYQNCSCESAFCKRCLDLYYDSNYHKCPICKKETRELMPSNNFNELIFDLNMKCKNLGCSWAGKLKDYRHHITEKCPKEFINCPNPGCIFKSRREEMLNHVSKCNNEEYICSKCQSKMKKADINSHKIVCPKEIIKCLKGCGKYIERENLILHERECPNVYMDCPYGFIGCKDKINKSEKEKRLILDSTKHLYLAISKIQNLSNEMQELKGKLNMIEKDDNELKKMFKEINEKLMVKNNLLEKNSKKEEKIKEKNLLNKEISINASTKSCKLLSKKRKLSLDNIIVNSTEKSIKDSSLFFNNKEENDKDQKNIVDHKIVKNVEKDYVYSFIENTRDLFVVKDNKIESNCLKGDKHYFVFFNEKYDIPKSSCNKYTFRVKLLQKIDWLSIGFCDRKLIENNGYEYDIKKTNKKKSIGIYIINTNQVIWNSNNIRQCTKLNYKRLNKKDTFIDCTLSPSECQLEFMVNKDIFFILNDVRCFLSDYFSPCLIFLKNATVESSFLY